MYRHAALRKSTSPALSRLAPRIAVVVPLLDLAHTVRHPLGTGYAGSQCMTDTQGAAAAHPHPPARPSPAHRDSFLARPYHGRPSLALSTLTTRSSSTSRLPSPLSPSLYPANAQQQPPSFPEGPVGQRPRGGGRNDRQRVLLHERRASSEDRSAATRRRTRACWSPSGSSTDGDDSSALAGDTDTDTSSSKGKGKEKAVAFVVGLGSSGEEDGDALLDEGRAGHSSRASSSSREPTVDEIIRLQVGSAPCFLLLGVL